MPEIAKDPGNCSGITLPGCPGYYRVVPGSTRQSRYTAKCDVLPCHALRNFKKLERSKKFPSNEEKSTLN
eukprot:1013534-Amorphochlora_amoeboformis.AAC.1